MCNGYIFLIFLLIISCNVHIYASITLDFDDNKNTILDGQWDYYSDQFIFNHNNLLKNQKDLNYKTVYLPNSFLEVSNQMHGYGSFRQVFNLPKDAVGKPLAIYIPYQYGAYEIYVNGQLMATAGKIGTSEATHLTEMSPRLFSFSTSEHQLDIVIQSSSFKHIRGGLENSIYIGHYQNIRLFFYQQILPTMIMSGILVMIGLFMIIFAIFHYAKGYKTHGWIFLGCFILFFSLRSWFAVPFIYTLFLPMNWLWGTRLEYLLTQLSCIAFLTYLYIGSYKLIHKYVYYLCAVTIVVNIIVTLITEPIVFQSFFFHTFSLSALFLANLLYSFILMIHQRVYFSKLNALAIFLLCLTFVHDYLLGLALIDSIEISFFSSCIYFIIVTLHISHDYASQSHKTALLNDELILLNKSLDQQVLERTETVTLLNEQLQHQLKIDTLTGAYNRFALNLMIEKEFEIAKCEGHSLAFFMIDVDYFKQYNDAYGHLRGDDVLRSIVKALSVILPNGAFLARYGGEEFTIVLSKVSYSEMKLFAYKCLEAIRLLGIEHKFRKDLKNYVTVSIGAAIFTNIDDSLNVVALMKKADHHLYIAKNNRDCAIFEE